MNKTFEVVKIALLTIIAVCGIVLVLQGYGLGVRNVNVTGGTLDVGNTVTVRGRVNVDNTVSVEGNVGIDNRVDINIEAINGHQDVFFNNPDRGERDKYYVLPITVQ